MTRAFWRATLMPFVLVTACATTTENAATTPAPPPIVRTCLVLSVGGHRGISHLGAIAALKELGLPVNCVVGNSMGALIGSLYATAPYADTTQRYRMFMDRYVTETTAEAKDRAATTGFLGAALVLLSGGTALPAAAVGLGGAKLGADSVNQIDLDRFYKVLDQFYGSARIESLPMTFATMHQEVRTEDGGMVDDRLGNLAWAVRASVANPLIFTKLDNKKAGVLDPGVDRVAMTPVDDACRMFPRSRLITVNVTSKPVFVSTRMDCPFVEIDVPDVPASAAKVLAGQEPDFTAVVRAGYDAAHGVLRAEEAGRTNEPTANHDD